MRPILPILLVANLAACGNSTPPPHAGAAVVSKLGERESAAEASPSGPGVDRPYFDARGVLAWDGSLAVGPAGGQACDEGTHETQRTPWLRTPRIDVVRCSTGPPLVVAYGGAKVLWRRPLGFRSGAYTIDQRVIGAGPDGVVLSDLTVLAPRTGEVVLPPRTHPVGSEARPVPDETLEAPALYLQDRHAFLHFSADVTLVRRQGGLYRIDARTGAATLLQPVAATAIGTAWRIEEMSRSTDGRYALLASRHDRRGGGGVAFAVLDLDTGKEIYRERFRDDHFCVDPRLAVGAGGKVGLAFRDQTAGQVVLVTFQLAPG
jgi:hypothetical protein